VGNVDNPHHSPDKREAHSNQGVNRTEHQPPDEDLDKIGHDHPSMIGIMEEWSNGRVEWWNIGLIQL